MPSTLSTLAVAASALLSTAQAVNYVSVQGQNFVVNATGARFEIIGVDYQPGGSAGYIPQSGIDPLSNGTSCLRDAALMQQLGVNTLRSYNLDPDLNHDECASIFNEAGIYMILDVNSPLSGQSINQADPASTYDLAYLNRTFAVVDAFRNYPNTLGFFSANELINSDATAEGLDPVYIRAVTRDLKQYIAARGGRTIPVGYSAADIADILTSNLAYVSCYIGDSSDMSRSDFFGLNNYQWCGNNTFTGSGYSLLASQFQGSSIPAFFSEYGCNVPEPRYFTEVAALYGSQMSMFSGGLVYEWTQGSDDYGLLTVNADESITLLADYSRLQIQYNAVNLTLLETVNTTAAAITAPICSAGLISSSNWNANFVLPDQPAGVPALISSGVGGRTGSIVSVTATSVLNQVTNTAGALITGLAIHSVGGVNVPTGASGAGTASATTTGTAKTTTTGTSAAAATTTTGTASGASASASASASATKKGAASKGEANAFAGMAAAAAGLAAFML